VFGLREVAQQPSVQTALVLHLPFPFPFPSTPIYIGEKEKGERIQEDKSPVGDCPANKES